LYLPPWKLPLMLRRLHILGQWGVKNFVPRQVPKVICFPREEHSKSSRDPSRNHVVLEDSQNYFTILVTFILVTFLRIFIHTQMIGCGQGGKQKNIYWVLWVDIRRGLWNFRCGDSQCTDRKG
jgi:hypothetical protein